MTKFVGRGEGTVGHILQHVFQTKPIPQCPIENLIPFGVWSWLDPEVRKHKFDFYILNKKIAVEVNYKHKEKAAKKYRQVFEPILKDHGIKLVQIHDYECPHLFKDKEHPIDVQDWQEVIQSLRTAGIK